jgi:pimeloyl-ACP methyl ester carboxylesterase
VTTLVVHGDADASVPLEVTGEPTAALLPDARLEVYPGAPHGVPLTHAERLAADIVAFARAPAGV